MVCFSLPYPLLYWRTKRPQISLMSFRCCILDLTSIHIHFGDTLLWSIVNVVMNSDKVVEFLTHTGNEASGLCK